MITQTNEDEFQSIIVEVHSKKEESISFWESIYNLTNITNLIYKVSRFKDDFEVYLPLILKKNPNLTSIYIFVYDNKMVLDFDKQPLTDMLKDKNLKEFTLNCPAKRNTGPSVLMQNICECFQFACIDNWTLKNYFITSQNLKFLSMMKNTRSVNFTMCEFEKGTKFEYSFHLKRIEIDDLTNDSEFGVRNLIKSIHGLEELYIRDLDFQFDFELINNSLKKGSLKKLAVFSQMIQNFDHFIDIIKNNTEDLELEIPEDGTFYDYPLFKDLKINSKIQSIEIVDSVNNLEGIDEFLTENKSLKKLSLGKISVKDGNIELISKGILKNNTIEKFSLFFATRKQMSILMDSLLCKNLIELSLFNCSIDDPFCELFQLFLSTNSNLKRLSLSSNEIKDEGFKKIINGMKINGQLEILDLNLNKFGNEGCKVLKDYLKLDSSLTDLDIGQCQYDIQGLEYILEGLQKNTKLKKIYLNFFKNLGQTLELLFFNTGLIFCNLNGSEIITKRNRKMVMTNSFNRVHFSDLQFIFQ